MEESITIDGIFDYADHIFELDEVDIKSYSPLTLAYIGDSIYDLLIKSIIIKKGNQQVNKLHNKTASLVKAHTQAEMIIKIEGSLTEEETGIFKRGRNAKSATTAKHASVGDYRKATGFEALIGYLYLKKDFKRIIDLVKLGLEGQAI